MLQFAAKSEAKAASRERLATWAKAFAASGDETIHDVGRLYVYEVNQSMYEVDWRLTTVQTLAVAAYRVGARLTCERVAARNRRLEIAPHISDATVRTPAVSFGQITLPWAT